MAIKWASVSSFHLTFDDVKSCEVGIDCIVMNLLRLKFILLVRKMGQSLVHWGGGGGGALLPPPSAPSHIFQIIMVY